MFTTFNGCYRSEISVNPKNWNTKKASTNSPWRINYRFYDPAFKDHPILRKGKQVKILGMNHYKSLDERQAATRSLIDDEKDKIHRLGYNPITSQYMAPTVGEIDAQHQEISPATPLVQALKLAFACCSIEPDTVSDWNSCLKYFTQSAIKLKKDNIQVKDLKRRDIELILNNCKNLTVTDKKGNMRPKIWNDNQFNHYRKYISILFAEIERQEIIEYNPVEKIPKKDTTPEDPDQAKRKVLTDDERKKVDAFLQTPKMYTFRRFVHVFFHSGARRKEIMKVQGKHIDLPGQRFKVLVKKGPKKRWVWKTIKDIALPYWTELMANCGPDDYIFSVGLKPGPRAIRPEQVTRRWSRHIKTLGIDPDLYSLKHLHTTEVRSELEKNTTETEAIKEVAEHNSHTSGAMVVQIYDVQHDKRQHKKVKGIKNSFAG